MPDGSQFTLGAGPDRKGPLFPLEPRPRETLVGFLVRSAGENMLPGPLPIRKAAGVGLEEGAAFSATDEELSRLAISLGITPAAIRGLWGSAPPSGGRRLLGGVWLRPEMLARVRRVPRSMGPKQSDDAFWMVRHLGFCPQAWELLIDRCPRDDCRRDLVWRSASALHLCSHCGAPVSEARRRRVPASMRPELDWLAALFSDDRPTVEKAMRSLPPSSLIKSPTEAYEVTIALARPMLTLLKPNIVGARVALEDVAGAARFLLHFPRSLWDLKQLAREPQISFLHHVDSVARHSTQPIVQQELFRILHYFRPNRAEPGSLPSSSPWLSTTQAASRLRVQRGDVRRLAQAGMLAPIHSLGGEKRDAPVFRQHEVERLKEQIDARTSWRDFRTATHLPVEAVEQLLARGLLSEDDDAAVRLLFSDRHLDARRSQALIWRVLGAAPEDNSDDYVPIEQVMMGVGGRRKPWARVIEAGVSGELPGGLRKRPGKYKIGLLTIHPVTARELIMGGPEYTRPFAAFEGDCGAWERGLMKSGEVERHLNCTAQDVSWLKTRSYLQAADTEEGGARFHRSEVESLGKRFVTTREIAARRGLKPAQVSNDLRGVCEGGSFGQGFYRRELIENWLVNS